MSTKKREYPKNADVISQGARTSASASSPLERGRLRPHLYHQNITLTHHQPNKQNYVMIEQKGWHSRGYLPHFDGLDVVQFITIRLFDSVPDEAIEKWKAEHNWSENTDGDTERTEQLIRFIDHYNDQGHGSCYLRIPEVASLIRDSLRFHDETRYQLIAWCVMPNHVHVLLKPLTGYAISKIVQSWKSFTAHRANKLLKRAGRFWMPDYFDRYIRTDEQYYSTIEYIHYNPVAVGLVGLPEEWEWSSACRGE